MMHERRWIRGAAVLAAWCGLSFPVRADLAHPWLADVPANTTWLVPSGTSRVQNLKPMDPGEPMPLVLRRDRILGRSCQIAVATDAALLMVTHGSDRLAVRLNGKASVPQFIELKGHPAEVRLDDQPVPDPLGTWPKMVQVQGEPHLTLEFVGAKQVKLQFDAQSADLKEAVSFFGVPIDPSDPAYQKLARHSRTTPTADSASNPPAAAAGSTVPARPESTDAAAAGTTGEPSPTSRPAPTPVARDFAEISTQDLVARVAPAMVRVEARTALPGVWAVVQGFFIDDTGRAVIPLDATGDAIEFKLSYLGGAGPTQTDARLLAIHADTGLGLIQATLPDGVRSAFVEIAAMPPGADVPAWVVGGPSEDDDAALPHQGAIAADGWQYNTAQMRTRWLAVRTIVAPDDLGAAVVNPAGEVVGVTTWQWSASRSAHLALGCTHVSELIDLARTTAPPTTGDLRAARAGLRGANFSPARLLIERPQPASGLQRETIALKRGYPCTTCKGEGQVDRQIHRQKSGNMGGGKDWYETVSIECPTCKGGKLAAPPAIGRMLANVASSLALTDPGDEKWETIRQFVGQTLDELADAASLAQMEAIVQSVGNNPGAMRLGQPMLATGVLSPVVQLPMLRGEAMLLQPRGGGTAVLLYDLKLIRASAGKDALAGGLYAGNVRLPDGSTAVVIQHGFTTPTP